MRVLGIETSCDETAVGLFDTNQGLLGHLTVTQTVHTAYGGVVPELASRDHVQKILPLIDALLKQTRTRSTELNGIAYTAGPGLAGALLVGATQAHGLALAWQLPTIGIHHLEGHLLAPFLEPQAPTFPFLTLLVSGGHTQLIRANALGQYQLLGDTLDDAVGEAFDKTAKLLGLPYPGGAALAALATQSRHPDRFRFPRPIQKKGLNFSFSGLKTAVVTLLKTLEPVSSEDKADIAKAFEEAAIDTLITKTLRALEQSALTQLVIAGGVAANQTLRTRLTHLALQQGFSVFYPRPTFCTDNGAMIAYAGALRLSRGESTTHLSIRPRWPLPVLSS